MIRTNFDVWQDRLTVNEFIYLIQSNCSLCPFTMTCYDEEGKRVCITDCVKKLKNWAEQKHEESAKREKANRDSDPGYAAYCEEQEKLIREWKEGDPWPVRSELDDTTGCVWVATNGDKIIGACECPSKLIDFIYKRSDTASDVRQWGMHVLKIIKGL